MAFLISLPPTEPGQLDQVEERETRRCTIDKCSTLTSAGVAQWRSDWSRGRGACVLLLITCFFWRRSPRCLPPVAARQQPRFAQRCCATRPSAPPVRQCSDLATSARRQTAAWRSRYARRSGIGWFLADSTPATHPPSHPLTARLQVHQEYLKRRYVASWCSFACCINFVIIAGAAILPLYIGWASHCTCASVYCASLGGTARVGHSQTHTPPRRPVCSILD